MKSLALCIAFFLVFVPDNFYNDYSGFQIYSFNQQITLEITSSSEDVMEMDFLFSNTNNNITAMSVASADGLGIDDKIFYVFSEENIDLFISTAGMKMKKSVPKNEFSQFDNLENLPEQSEIKKTGNTKLILGYTCQEYSFKNKDGEVSAWVCNNFPVNNKFVPMLGMKANGPFDGFVMELQVKVSNVITNLKIIDYKKNINISIDSSKYNSF